MEGAFWVLIAMLVVLPLGLLFAVAGPLKGTHSGKIIRMLAFAQLAFALLAVLIKVLRQGAA